MALADIASRRPANLSRLIARARGFLSDKSHSALAQRVAGTAFLIRVASAGLAYVLQIFLARWMGQFEFGIYVYVWTWILLIGAFTPLGLAYLGQRVIPEYKAKRDARRLRGYLRASRWLCLGFGAAAGALGAVIVLGLRDHIPAYNVTPFLIAFACLPIFAVSAAQDSIARAYNWIDLALVPVYIAQPILLIVFVAAVHFAGFHVDAVASLFGLTLIFWAVVLMQTAALNKRLAIAVKPGPRRYDIKIWMRTALPLLMVDGFFFLLTYIDILLLEFFVSPDEIAVYYAAVKTLALVVFIYFSVTAACAHRFSEYHAKGDKKRLAAFAADATRWTFWPSLAMAALLIVFGKWILMLFGAGFAFGYPLIVILAVGLLARASVGPAERLLNMVGQQKICALVYAIAVCVNVILCVTLAPLFGLTGAAVATASALVVESILLFAVVKTRVGINVFVKLRF